MPRDMPKVGELTTGQREARQPGKTKRRAVHKHNAVRAREAHMRCYDGGIGHDDWIRTKECLCCTPGGRRRSVHAAHATARGMGGRKGRWYHLVPLCEEHHTEQGNKGNAHIYEVYGADLKHEARVLAAEHLKEIGAI